MSFPEFLVIGAMRSGTTWLDKILRSHPQIFLPEQRKEVHFFDRYYDRGLTWYETFFPAEQVRGENRIPGEITPMYLYDENVPGRIFNDLPGCKFIAILRNPVKRAFSQYCLSIRDNNEKRSFGEYILQEPDVFARGLYSIQIKRYFALFQKNKFHFLIFEKAVSQPEVALKKIASFLNIEYLGFDAGYFSVRENKSYQPRLSGLYAMARKIGRKFRDNDIDWVVNISKKLKIQTLFGKHDRLPKLEENLYFELLEKYKLDIRILEDLIQEDLGIWLK
ncbi:MAG: sulfotransferase [Thermodesulfobacteriota bacterium]